MLALAALLLGPAKLVILYGQAPPTVVSYPSMERCERARRALLAQAERHDPSQERLPSGTLVIHRGVSAYCIPG